MSAALLEGIFLWSTLGRGCRAAMWAASATRGARGDGIRILSAGLRGAAEAASSVDAVAGETRGTRSVERLAWASRGEEFWNPKDFERLGGR